MCFSKQLPILVYLIIGVLQPRQRLDAPGLGFSRFARRYSGNLFDFFSSAYLDVSVQRVGLFADICIATDGLSHSDTRESFGYVHLIPDFRSLSRPSSPPGATGIPRVLFFAFLKLLLDTSVSLFTLKQNIAISFLADLSMNSY